MNAILSAFWVQATMLKCDKIWLALSLATNFLNAPYTSSYTEPLPTLLHEQATLSHLVPNKCYRRRPAGVIMSSNSRERERERERVVKSAML